MEVGVMLALFFIIHQTRRERPVFIAGAHTLIAARLRAALASHPGEYVEGGLIAPTMARKVPKGMIGRTLTQAEAEKLLARLQAVPAKRKR